MNVVKWTPKTVGLKAVDLFYSVLFIYLLFGIYIVSVYNVRSVFICKVEAKVVAVLAVKA